MNETMNKSRVDVARAWKDAAYREGLSEAERAALPENPAGLMELSDADLMAAEGGKGCIALVCAGNTVAVLSACW